MQNISDETLVAFVDDELDASARAVVEATLAENEDLQERVRLMRVSATTLSGAYRSALAEPIPERILASIEAMLTSGANVDGSSGQPAEPSFTMRRVLPFAMAASLAFLLIGGGVGFMAAKTAIDRSLASAVFSQATLQVKSEEVRTRALEYNVSGRSLDWQSPDKQMSVRITPVRTFISGDGRPCREFREETAKNTVITTQIGVACRTAELVWQTYVKVTTENDTSHAF